MRIRNRIVAAAVWFLACHSVIPAAVAWNSAGHMIIDLIAYGELDNATRSKAIGLIRAHPRFRDHFESFMPREVSRGSASEKDEWLFAHAGTWPDLVRDARGAVNRQDVTQYNRPFWHFINEPVFLNDADRRLMERSLTINLRREPLQDPDDEFMNVVQALKNSARIVKSPASARELRSVHLCWLNHLAGDSHQPLHAAALYTTHRFRNGDRGGNYLEYEHAWDLHAFWDDQISNDEPYRTLRVLAGDLKKNRELASAGERAAATVDSEKWIDESNALAKRFAYTPEVLEKIAAREGHSHLGPLHPGEKYATDAETVAERRAVEAGYRLAKLLKELLK
jgi:hypothetical protein